MLQNKRALGAEMETLAAEYLTGQGLVLTDRNFYCHFGEIDLIFRDGNTVVFVEVKYRRAKDYGWGAEAVTRKKQETIVKCARYYLYFRRFPVDTPCRFDVIEINGREVHWLKDAFDASGGF